MTKIHLLSHDVIAKIAAGEVIERPVFAIKELLENSIDANSTVIKIELEQAGLKKICVTDNGEGMGKDDLGECYKPHTTSKIKSEEDLFSVHSLGFRGEALASIAAISTVVIRSRTTQDNVGNEIKIAPNSQVELTPFGMPTGTQIIISGLFDAIPARKKFLTNSALEFKLIAELVTSIAIASPEVSITLIHNNKKIIDLAKNQSLKERIESLLGTDIAKNLLPVHVENEYLQISGFIVKPHISAQSTSKQFVYVNKRKVNDKKLSASIKSIYGTLLESKVQPIFFLFISLPFERVDVNVHPRKEYVAFTDPELVLSSINDAITKTLSQTSLIYNDKRWKKGRYAPSLYEEQSVREGNVSSFTAQILKDSVSAWNSEVDVLQSSEIIQLHDLYLVYQTKKSIVLIDQHAAHERILYEQYLNEFILLRQKGLSVKRSPSIHLELSAIERNSLEENYSFFEELGYRIIFSLKTELIAAPNLFKDRNHTKLIRELLEDIESEQKIKNIDSGSHKMIAFLACRKAIKAGDKVTREQAENIIKKLNECENKYTCPHGRPTQVEISLKELHYMFHRR